MVDIHSSSGEMGEGSNEVVRVEGRNSEKTRGGVGARARGENRTAEAGAVERAEKSQLSVTWVY